MDRDVSEFFEARFCPSDDTLRGGADGDFLSGGNGNDSLEGGDGSDQLQGDTGNDILVGGAGGDFLFGGGGQDTLNGGAGSDQLSGDVASNNELFIFSEGDDSLVGFTAGAGSNDVIDLSAHSGALDFAGLSISDTAEGALITLGATDTILLHDVAGNTLTEDHFQF